MCSESTSSTDPQTQPPQCTELCGYHVVLCCVGFTFAHLVLCTTLHLEYVEQVEIADCSA